MHEAQRGRLAGQDQPQGATGARLQLAGSHPRSMRVEGPLPATLTRLRPLVPSIPSGSSAACRLALPSDRLLPGSRPSFCFERRFLLGRLPLATNGCFIDAEREEAGSVGRQLRSASIGSFGSITADRGRLLSGGSTWGGSSPALNPSGRVSQLDPQKSVGVPNSPPRNLTLGPGTAEKLLALRSNQLPHGPASADRERCAALNCNG